MTVILLPDVEQLLSGWLRAQPALAALIGERIYTAIPANATYPLLRVYRIGGVPALKRVLWLDSPLVQFDVWGGTKGQARLVADTARALLFDTVGEHADGVVANVELGELRYEPDAQFSPARPRYLFTATLTTHPGDGSGGS